MDAAGDGRGLRGPRERRRRPSRARHRVPRSHRRARCRSTGHNSKPLIVCKSNSRKLIRKIFKGKKQARKRRIRLRQFKKCRFRHIQSAVNRAKTNDRIQIMPGVYREEPSRKIPVDQAECRSMFEVPERRRRAGADLRAPGQLPERAQPDRDHRRLARRPRPRVRPEVQPADRGHGPQAQGRADRGRPAQEGRHPRRPRRRLLPPQRVGRAGRVQQRRRRRDERLPPAPARHALRAELRRPHASPPTTASTSTSRRTATATPASTRAPAPRATASATASRSATSTRTTTCSATRARRATARTRTTRRSTTTTPASPTTRSPPATRACRRTARSGTTTRSTRTTRTTSRTTATPTARDTPFEKRPKEIVCPQFQVPVGSGFILYGVNDEHHPGQRDLRQLALGRAAVLGAGGGPRRERPGQAVRHLERQPLHRQPARARRRRHAPAERRSTSSGTSRASTTAGRATSRPAAAAHERSRRCCRSARRARVVPASQPGQDRRRGALRAPGIRRRSRTRPAAPGSRPRPPAAMRWALAATVLLLAGVGGLLLLGDRDGGATQAATDTARLQWKSEPLPDHGPRAAARPHPHRPGPQRLAARGRPRVRAHPDPRRGGPPPEGDRAASRRASSTGSTRRR